MTVFDPNTYAVELAARRLDLAVWDESKHPRLHGRFRKGQSVKLLYSGKAKIVDVDHEAGRATVQEAGKSYTTNRPLSHMVPTAEKPKAIKDIHTAEDAAAWGVHHDVKLELGDKLSPEAIRHVVTAVHKRPATPTGSHGQKKFNGIIAASTTDAGDKHGHGGARQHIDANPKTVLLHNPGMTGQTVYINDLHRADEINAGDMKALTNPAGDKKVSAAHKTFEGLVHHELGHVHDFAHRTDPQHRAHVEEVYAKLGKDWIVKHVSHYAAASPTEFYAEAYALLHSDTNLSPEVEKHLREVVAK